MEVWGWDLETELWGPGRIAPRPLCASFARLREDRTVETSLVANGDADFADALRMVFAGPHHVVGHNIGNYDISCVAAHYPDLVPLIFKALEEGRLHDTKIREKILDLSIGGEIEFDALPDGTFQKRLFSLAELEKRYIGRDRSAAKDDDDAWRGNYIMLDGRRAEDYPAEAARYAMEDAEGALLVYYHQEARCSLEGGSLATAEFHVGIQHCLRLMSCWGMAVDPVKKAEIEAQLREELNPVRLRHLLAEKILWPPGSKRPTKRKRSDGSIAEGYKTVKKEEISESALRDLIVAVCEEHGIEVKMTDPSDSHPDGQVAKDKNFLQEIAHLHPALEEYQYRQYLGKLVTTELPRMGDSILYPAFNVPVASGRTSSYDPFSSDRKKKAAKDDPTIYYSANVQNVAAVKKLHDEHGNPRGEVNVRECYVARGYPEAIRLGELPPKVLCSIDYNSMEFCSMGQVCYRLFGHSTMRDLINGGRDPHAYLGAQIALAQHEEFAELCRDGKIEDDPLAVYDLFKSCEKREEVELREFYKQYRKLAKPVGFGFPGGLGAEKFVGFAKAHPYYVVVTEEQAKELKRLWLSTFPEMREYFQWINQQKDPRDPSLFYYASPFGMIRAGAGYTDACNGALLQTPGADGAKLGVWEVTRACYDPAQGSILYGQRPLAFVHDEILLELDYDHLTHDRAMEAARLMIDAMCQVMPDMHIGAEPALMFRWNKDAKPCYGPDKRLVPWFPDNSTEKALVPPLNTAALAA